jgi:hypothetical protein
MYVGVATGRKQAYTHSVRPRGVNAAHDGLAAVGEDFDDRFVDKDAQLQPLAVLQLEWCGLYGFRRAFGA